MLELMAMSYVVSVCLYLARFYPTFPKNPLRKYLMEGPQNMPDERQPAWDND